MDMLNYVKQQLQQKLGTQYQPYVAEDLYYEIVKYYGENAEKAVFDEHIEQYVKAALE